MTKENAENKAEPKDPEKTEREVMTGHMRDLEAWLEERKLAIFPRPNPDIVPVGRMGEAFQISALWDLVRVG